jgi:DHA1 family tetracycline resistance protein-like MFS transporter
MTTSATLAQPRSGNLNFVLISVFVDMLGIGLIVPVLPGLVGEFVTDPGQQAHWYSLLSATFGLMQFLFMPMVGAISDRIGRRPVLLYSMGGMCINFLATAWAPNLACLFIGRVVGGASSASMSVAAAYASDVSTPENRAKSFGKIGAAFGFGFVCGPVLGGLLGNVGLHLPFYVAGALSAANFVYGYVAVPESLPRERRTPFRWNRVNPFGALLRLARRDDIRGLIVVYMLVSFAQMMLQTTWVLFTTYRFGWTPRDNGIALFCVGVCSIVVQAGLLAPLIRRFGEVRLSLIGVASGAVTYFLYALATHGWMMYVFILCNLLSFAAGPALQGILSNASSSREQGELMGSLQSASSIGLVIMPMIGGELLRATSHLPPLDWRVGGPFFVCAAMQATALLVAHRYFRSHGIPETAPAAEQA